MGFPPFSPTKKQARSTLFDPPQGHDWDASETHIGLTVYLTAALPDESNGIHTGHTVQRGACPKHGDASRSHRTFLHMASRAEPPPRLLHIQGPSKFTRVDKPHPASIAGSRLAVAGSARKDVAQVIWNGSCIADCDNRKFSKDTLNGNYIEYGFPVVKLVTIREPTDFNHPEAHK